MAKAKYSKASELSLYVNDLEKEQERKKKLQALLDNNKQNSSARSRTTVRGKTIAPIRTDSGTVGSQILRGRTISQAYGSQLDSLGGASRMILSGYSDNPFSIENMQAQQQARRQQEQKELEEKAKKQSQSTPVQSTSDKSDNVNLKLIKTVNDIQHKKVDELGKKVGEETERLGILNDFSGNDLGKVTNIMFTKNNNNSRKLLNDKLFADKFNNQFSDKIRISDKQQTSAEKLTGRKIEKLDKKKGETDFQAIIRAQQENTKKRLELEKTDLYKQYAKEHNTELLTQYLYDTERVKSEKTTTEDKINPIRGFMSGLKSSLSPRDYVDENGRRLSLPNYNQLKTDKVIQDSGKLGKAYQGAMTSAGQMAPAMLASAVPRVGKALGLATTWVTTYNSAKNQKMLEGYSEEDAEKYAKVNASLETGLGGTLGGLTKIMGGKQSAFASNIQKLLDKFVTNKGVSRFASQAFAEVTEEELQNVLDPINEHLTLGKYKNLDEALGKVTLDDATTTALSTLMLVGITEGRTSKNVAKLQKDIEAINKEYGTDFKFKDGSNEKVVDKNIGKETNAKDLVNKAKTGVITTNDMEVEKDRKLSDNEQMVVDNVVENRKKALEDENGKVSAREIKKIKKEVTQSMREGTLDVNDIERVMSNEEWARHSEANKQSENLKAQIQELESKSPTDYNTMGEINSANEKLSNLKAELNNIDTKKTKDELTNSVVSKLTDDDILLKQNLINSELKQNKPNELKEEPINEEPNGSFDLKQKQLDIINENNPMHDDIHTGIRSVEDIKTPEEAFESKIDLDEDYTYPDFTQEDGKNALGTGKITVYSSYPIEQGVFVSPSKMMAQDYAGSNNVYSKEIDINDVAWLNSTEGQYAKVEKNAKIEYNNKQENKGVVENDFSRVQKESGKMSSEESALYHRQGKTVDEALRTRLSRVFENEINSRRSSDRSVHESVIKNENFDIAKTDGKTFHDIFEIAQKYLPNGELVDVHDNYDNIDCYISKDGLSGFAIEENGNLISVYNLSDKRGFLKTISNFVKQNAKMLDCYNSQLQPLASMYEKLFGFKTASIMDYNMEYDHDNIAENHNMPQVAFMVNTNKDVETKSFNKDQYDEAEGYRNSFVTNDESSSSSFYNDNKSIAPIKEENKTLKKEINTLKKEITSIKENASITQKEFEEQNKRIAPLLKERVAPPKVESTPNVKDTTKMNKKDIKTLSKNMKQQLGLTKKQKLDLENIIQEYSTSETATRDDLFKEIKDRFGKESITTEFEDIKKVQNEIKNIKLNVSQNIKNDITDYNKLKQRNFGKIRFNRDGQPVDVVYRELSETYPGYFPSNIFNESDQFKKIVEVANLENKSVSEYNIDEDYLRETSDFIYDSIQDYKQDSVKKAVENERKESFDSLIKGTDEKTAPIKKEPIDIERVKQNPNGYLPYLEMAKEISPEVSETNKEVVDYLNEIDSNKKTTEEVKTKPQGKIKKAISNFQYYTTNRNEGIDKYAKATGNKEIKFLGDNMNNLQGLITSNINKNQTDIDGRIIGKGVNPIFSQAREKGLSEPFDDYLFHLSNIERHKNDKGSVVPMNESEELVKQYEKKYPEMKKWAGEVNNYFVNLLYNQVEAGLIKKEVADSIVARYDFYVPFIKNIDGEYARERSNTIKTRSTVKSARGLSDRNLLPFEEAMMKKTQTAITQMNYNKLFQEIIKTRDNANMDFEDNANPFIDVQFTNENGKFYITGYVKGKATQVQVDKNLYRSLEQHEAQVIKGLEEDMKLLTKPLQTASEIKRNLVTTWSPTFIATNFIKDIHDGFWNTKYTKEFAKNYPKAFKQLATGRGGEKLEMFLNSYGNANLRGNYNMIESGVYGTKDMAQTKTPSKFKGIRVAKSMANKVASLNQVVELAPRYAEYLSSIEKGCSHAEAMYNAREVTVNFGRGGVVTKAVNRNGFNFLNASVQGLSKFARNLSGDNGTKGVVGSIAKATAFGLAPALINAILLGDDDDYQAIPDYIKDNYILIKIDEQKADKLDKTGKVVKSKGTSYLRIPYGRAMSIFGSAGRRTLERLRGNRSEISLGEDIKSWGKNAWNQVGISDLGASFLTAPISQAKRNEAWYGGEIIPKRLQKDKEGNKIPAEEQYDSSIDKMSIWLGKHTGISPYKINYVIDQYSGGIGDIILPSITEEAQSNTNSLAGRMLAPIKDKFTADSITDNKNVTNFYSKYEELGVKKSRTNNKKDELGYEYMKGISFEMGKLYSEMRSVQEDKNLTRKQKYAKAQNIKAEINKLATEGMNGYKDVEAYENYARVGDRELHRYTNKDGETNWYSANEKYDKVVDDLGLSTKEKNEYYTTQMNMSSVANKYNDKQGSERYHAVVKTIKNSSLPSDAKYQLYNNWYGNGDDKTSYTAQNVGIDADEYLKFKSKSFTSDKTKNGGYVRGSKAKKITNYLNKNKTLSYGEKAILYRMSFGYKGSYTGSYYSNKYNTAIVNYVNSLDTTYDEDVNIYKTLGFKVDRKGNISWR